MTSRGFEGRRIVNRDSGLLIPSVPYTINDDPIAGNNMIEHTAVGEFQSRVSEFAEGIVGGIVSTKGLFTMGIHKLCEINATFMNSIRDTTMQCAASFKNRTKEPAEIQSFLDSINEYLYTKLDGNYVLVLNCDEIVDEAQSLDSYTFNEYVDYCARFNLMTASFDAEILSQIQTAFLTYQRSMNPGLTAENYIAPNSHAVVFFLIELMFTQSGPSYTTSTDEHGIIHFYRRVTSDRRKINNAALKAQTSITWNKNGNLVTIKPKYVGTTREGKAYPTQTGAVIHNDYPPLGNYEEQRIAYLKKQITKAEHELIRKGILPSHPYERGLLIRSAMKTARLTKRGQSQKASRGSINKTKRNWAQDEEEKSPVLIDTAEMQSDVTDVALPNSQASTQDGPNGGRRKTSKKRRLQQKNKGRKMSRKSNRKIARRGKERK